MKSITKVSALLSVLTLCGVMSLATSAQAQRRVCIVNDANQVVCGRPVDDNNSPFGGSTQNFRDQINNLYRSVLEREPNRNELRAGVRDLERGLSLSDIRRDLARSPEAYSKLNQIYLEVLGREADPAGVEGWRKGLAGGSSLRDIRRAIQNSDEAKNRRRQ
jgi:hypothetical protein